MSNKINLVSTPTTTLVLGSDLVFEHHIMFNTFNATDMFYDTTKNQYIFYVNVNQDKEQLGDYEIYARLVKLYENYQAEVKVENLKPCHYLYNFKIINQNSQCIAMGMLE